MAYLSYKSPWIKTICVNSEIIIIWLIAIRKRTRGQNDSRNDGANLTKTKQTESMQKLVTRFAVVPQDDMISS